MKSAIKKYASRFALSTFVFTASVLATMQSLLNLGLTSVASAVEGGWCNSVVIKGNHECHPSSGKPACEPKSGKTTSCGFKDNPDGTKFNTKTATGKQAQEACGCH